MNKDFSSAKNHSPSDNQSEEEEEHRHRFFSTFLIFLFQCLTFWNQIIQLVLAIRGRKEEEMKYISRRGRKTAGEISLSGSVSSHFTESRFFFSLQLWFYNNSYYTAKKEYDSIFVKMFMK